MSVTNSDQTKYKWEVRPGGTQTAESLNIGHNVSQANTTSIKKSLVIDQNHTDVRVCGRATRYPHGHIVWLTFLHILTLYPCK